MATAISTITSTKLDSDRWMRILLPKRSPTRPHSGAHSAATSGVTPSVMPVQTATAPTSVVAERLEVERQERHHQREAGEADEGGHHQGGLVAVPATVGHRSLGARRAAATAFNAVHGDCARTGS